MCGGGKGGSQTTSSSSNSTATQTPPDYLNSAYQSLVSQAQNTASTPLSLYPANEMLAPFSNLQNQGLSAVQAAQGVQNPYINAASNAINSSQTPVMNGVQQFSPSTIQSYENPYQTDVTNATMAEINQTNAQQQSQLQGNAVSSNALGGDRAGIAAAALANQQGLAANQTLAQLNNQNYAQAETELNTQQQTALGANEAQGWLNSQAGSLDTNLGVQAQNTALTGSNALLNSGLLEQQQEQNQLNIPYEQYTQQEAYPFQTSQYLANILEGIGGVAGGTTTGSATGTSTTSQDPSLLSEITGGVETAAGLGGTLFGGSSSTVPTFGTSSSTPFSGASSINDAAAYGLNDLGYGETAYNMLDGQKRGGRTYSHGGIVPRRALAQGGSGGTIPGQVTGMTSGFPNVDVSFIPLVPPSGARGDFPNLPSPPSTSSGGGGSSSSGGGLGSLLSLGSSIASLFNRGGGIAPRPGYAGGGSLFSSMGAARHLAPRIAPSKTPDLLKVPKFDDGGVVGQGIGGLFPNAQNQNPITQSLYSRYSSLPTEKLQELAARTGGSQQGAVIQQALKRKQMMPNAPQPASQQVAAPANPFQTTGSFASGGVSRKTRRGFDDGGVPDGISIPYPAPPDFTDDAATTGAAASGVAANAAAPAGLAASTQPSYGFVPSPVTHHDPLPPATHYTADKVGQGTTDPWQVLMAAGAATLAGRGTGVQNIGQGVEAGLKNYYGQKQQNADRDYKQASVDDAVNRLNQEADQHRDTINKEQEQLDQNSIRDTNQAAYQQGELALHGKELSEKSANDRAERMKPIPDGYGGFLIPNPNDPAHPTPMDVMGGTSTDGSTPPPSIKNLYNHPKDKDGNPLKGDAFYATLPPAVAAQAKSYQSGNSPPPTGFATKPVLLAAYQAAQDGDDTFRQYAGTRFQTIKDFANPNSKAGQTVKAQNVTMEHISTLRDAVDALNNNDIPAFNAVANTIAKQTGQPAPTNFELGRQLVSDEIAKAVLGSSGASVDREGIKNALSVNASHDQAYQALDQAGQYMAGQASGLEQSYRAGTGLSNYRDRFLTPPAKALIDKYYPQDENGVPQQKSSGKSSAAQSFPNAPPVGTVKQGFKYTGGNPADRANWTQVPQ